MVAIRELLPAERFDALLEEFRELARRFNSGDGSARIPTEYLLIVAHKRG